MRILLTIAALFFLFIGADAQTTPAQKSDNYIITTNPSGATAYFYGDYDLVVNTPANLPSNLSGKYKVRISRPGYESWKGELSFVPGSSNSVNIELAPKTRLKAGLRSLLIPGWGQYYSGNSSRGAMFTLGVLGSGVILYYADRRFQDRRTEYNIAYQNYANATSINDRNRLKPISDGARQAASQAETDRRRVFYVGMGLWIYNIFDSVIFFPEGSAYFPAVHAIDGGGAGLSFLVKF